jgi:hypothetical protein
MTASLKSATAARNDLVTAGAQPHPGAAIFAGVFVMSFSSLLLELALTRLFSVILFYHFAFLAISIALLGLGAGGVFACLKRDYLARWETPSLGAFLAATNAILIVAVLEVVLHVPVALQLTSDSFLRLTVIYLTSAAPFFFTGLTFSVVFAREKLRVAALYGADLVGAAGACLAVVPLLNLIGGPNTVIFAALGMAVSAICWPSNRRHRRYSAGLAAMLALLIAANYSGALIDVIYTKGARNHAVEFARWNAISRVDVNRGGDGSKWATIDADAGTFIMNVDPRTYPGSTAQKRMMREAPSVANLLRPRGEFAIIGPGGGVDVLRALGSGSPSVTGIEINPLIATRIMRDRYADYSHHLYQLPQVHIHVSDGRSWIRSTPQQFDVVQMTLVDTWASTAAGAFALSENNLYTVEAFQDYFNRLRPDGIVAVTRWEFRRPREALRVVSVAMEALHRLGVGHTARHFIVVSQGALDLDGVPVAVIAKKSPFTPEEESAVIAHLAASGPAAQQISASGEKAPAPLTALYLPSMPAQNPFSALIASENPYGFSRGYDFNIAPVTDNAPFFFFTMKLDQLVNRALQRGIDWKVNVGVAVLGMVLVISIVAVAVFLVLPLLLGRARAGHRAPLLYFVAVGLAYILVEIAFIQRFVLFLGHPTYALTVVVFLMLLASGAGSMLSRSWLSDPRRVRVPLAVTSLLVGLYLAVLPGILSACVGLPFALKLLLSAGLLVPLAFLMGMPFPAGLRALHGAKQDTVEWAWALNAASSVLASVLAMVVAIQFGLQAALGCGAVAYVLAAGLMSAFPAVAPGPDGF